MELIRYHIRKRRAEHRDRRGEHDTRTVAGQTDCVKQGPRSIEIDPIAKIEIRFGFSRNDAGKVEDNVRL